MARLSWGAPSNRLYETGVDRAVLFVNGNAGVAWNGIISVSETPSGGSARPFYIDGIKYLNIASAEEYGAILNAYAHPKEFLSCDGVASIHNGLFATAQPRKSFSLSYRTLVGNDVVGTELGYKIHLVYNLLAEPAQRRNQSLDSSGAPSVLSWRLTSKPPPITGYKRTSHLIVDSRTAPPSVLAELEDILYGTDLSLSSMPSPDQVVALFTP